MYMTKTLNYFFSLKFPEGERRTNDYVLQPYFRCSESLLKLLDFFPFWLTFLINFNFWAMVMKIRNCFKLWKSHLMLSLCEMCEGCGLENLFLLVWVHTLSLGCVYVCVCVFMCVYVYVGCLWLLLYCF